MNDKKSPILKAVKNAQAVTKKGDVDKWGNRRCGDYMISDGLMYKIGKGRETRNDSGIPQIVDVYTKLTTDHAALIKEELILDNGMELTTAFVIEGQQKNGSPLPEVTIPATQYAGMTWLIKNWGTRAQIEAHQATARYLSAAILQLSGEVPRTTVFQYTGWKLIDSQWRYLTGSGSVGTDGLQPNIRVDLGGGHMKRYQLPEAADGIAPIASVFGLKGIAPNNQKIGMILLGCVVRAVLGECLPIDFALFVVGQSGSQKSELAALALAFFGKFDARSFPSNWSDTDTDLEYKSHQTKDSVSVVDDYAPSVNRVETQKLHAKSERLIRNTGNHAGRSRRNVDMTAKPGFYPRGLIIATGEDLPRGASLLGRLLIMEMERGDIDLSILTDYQRRAKTGELASVMTAFLTWLSPRMEDYKKTFAATVAHKRDEIIGKKTATSHPRSADIFAQIYCAMDIFLMFAENAGALNKIAAEKEMLALEQTLTDISEAQSTYQRNANEVDIFMDLLRSALTTGDAHLTASDSLSVPETNRNAWGWRRSVMRDPTTGEPIFDEHGQEKYSYSPNGQHIGYVRLSPGLNDEVWLEPEAAYKAVQRFATAQGNPLLIDKATLWKNMLARGLLAAWVNNHKTGVKRPVTKRQINYGHQTKQVLVIDPSRIIAPVEKGDHNWKDSA